MPSIAIIGELNLDLIVTGAPRMPNPGEWVSPFAEGCTLPLP